MDEVSCRLNQVQEAGDVGSPVREDGLGGLLSGEAYNVVGPVDLGVDAAIRYHAGNLRLERGRFQAQQLSESLAMAPTVVQRSDPDVVLNNAGVERLLPVCIEVRAADRKGRHGLKFGLVLERVINNFLGKQKLDGVLAGLDLLQIGIQVDAVQHVLLLVAVLAEGKVNDGALEGLSPLSLVGLDRGGRVNIVIILGKLEGILLVAVIFRHEGEIFDLVVLHPLLVDGLLIDLASNDRRADVVLLPERESHLLEDELDLLALRQRAVRFDVNVLKHICRGRDVPIFLLFEFLAW